MWAKMPGKNAPLQILSVAVYVFDNFAIFYFGSLINLLFIIITISVKLRGAGFYLSDTSVSHMLYFEFFSLWVNGEKGETELSVSKNRVY